MASQERQEERAFRDQRRGADVHCVLSGGNSKCKGPGVREGERMHGKLVD